MKLDSATSFKFNVVVSELQAKLDSSEKMLRPVKAVKIVDKPDGVRVWNLGFGPARDRKLEWESLLLEKLDRILDRCPSESRRGLVRLQNP